MWAQLAVLVVDLKETKEQLHIIYLGPQEKDDEQYVCSKLRTSHKRDRPCWLLEGFEAKKNRNSKPQRSIRLPCGSLYDRAGFQPTRTMSSASHQKTQQLRHERDTLTDAVRKQ